MDVVIPVWNEEAWLDRLLTRLKGFPQVQEIFVVDNASVDRSREVALSHGCTVLQGGRPARSRNIGAAAARSALLLFVDADTIVPEATIKTLIRAFDGTEVSAVHFRTVPLTRSALIKFLYFFVHCYLKSLSGMGISQGIGTAIGVRASVVRLIVGFREEIAVGEDADFLRRAAQTGRVLYLSESVVYTSARRLLVESRVVFGCKVAVWAILRLLKVRASVFDYNWEQYPPGLAAMEDELILELKL